MDSLLFSPLERAAIYADVRKLTIDKNFGGGVDGVVVGTTKGTAIKSFNHPQLYQQELAVYRYLTKEEIFSVCDFQIPKLIDQSDDHLVIEMTIVTPPFVLDFVGAKLEEPEPFPEEIMEEWRAERREVFGSDWPLVNRVMYALSKRGVYLTDIHLGNIRCR